MPRCVEYDGREGEEVKIWFEADEVGGEVRGRRERGMMGTAGAPLVEAKGPNSKKHLHRIHSAATAVFRNAYSCPDRFCRSGCTV